MLGKKIVVKYSDGKIIKGYTTDFNPNKDLFHVRPIKEYQEEGLDEQVEVKIKKIKAVFFVKDFLGNKEYQKVRTFNGYDSGPPSQRKIVVIFKDGEKFYGTTHSYAPDRDGFFVYPIDHQDNNDRVFVPRSALEKVHVKKFGSEDFDIYLYEN
jgi:small nuclear ribonucleoprotein (snRNP)-like protein